VIDGTDPGGISEAVGWKGGGGFRYYRLAPSLVQFDKWGNAVINKEFNPELLAEAVCKLMGFRYEPSTEEFWQHGHSTEQDFIYVTTQTLGREQLSYLSDVVGPERSLLVCCAAFRKGEAELPNLTVKKIPHTVLTRCEWGRDDYSLKIAEMPEPPASVDSATEEDLATKNTKGTKKASGKKKAVAETNTQAELTLE
jgi:adenine-specific DNA-methyltransferase